MPSTWLNWRMFWLLWLAGIVIIVALVGQNDRLVTEIAPQGMVDHQIAGTAKRVEEIHDSWRAAGAMGFFRIAIIFDLVFIILYSSGGVIGGLLIRKDARFGLLKALAGLAIIAYAAFGFLDFTETVCQAIQGFLTGGNDVLAQIAALAQPPKMIAFFIGFPSLVAALVWYGIAKRGSA